MKYILRIKVTTLGEVTHEAEEELYSFEQVSHELDTYHNLYAYAEDTIFEAYIRVEDR